MYTMKTFLPFVRMQRSAGSRRHDQLCAAALLIALCGCASTPAPTAKDGSALIMVPVGQTASRDARGEFRNVFCTVLDAREVENRETGGCEHYLIRLPDEPEERRFPVSLEPSRAAITVIFIAGFASDCVDQARQAKTQYKAYLARFGYHFETLRVSGTSSSESNAQQIRDALDQMPSLGRDRNAVVIAHSKGVVDTLEALVTYPELQDRIAAVISLAGAIGGSPLADLAPDAMLTIMQNTPGLQCEDGDAGALTSLSPQVRRNWLAENPLPERVPLYSVVALPTPERVSRGLKASYHLLSDIDPRNDGNLIYYDQVIPGSTLLGYVNADHWAISTDLGASPYALVRSLADQSDFPREALAEAVLRFVELDSEDTD